MDDMICTKCKREADTVYYIHGDKRNGQLCPKCDKEARKDEHRH
mgnify:CR=1 FL=1